MRKALMGLILAATAMTPVAAWAQDEDGGREARIQARQEARQQARSEGHSQPQAQRQQSQGDVQRSQVARERSGGDWGQARSAERNRGQWGDQQRSDVARERNRGQWGSQQRNEQVVQQQEQQQQQVERRRSGWGDRNTGTTTERSTAYPQAWQGNPNDPARSRYERLERRNQYRYGTQEQREQVRNEVRSGDRNWRDGDRRNWRDGDRRSRTDWSRNWDRNSWRGDRRYDWRNWRYSNRNLFRLSPYYSPYRNYGYSRFSIGFFLEPLFYSQRYWISDPYQYRLPYAPPGTQWVRYYNDVLLVDTWSGEVIDVIYDFFW